MKKDIWMDQYIKDREEFRDKLRTLVSNDDDEEFEDEDEDSDEQIPYIIVCQQDYTKEIREMYTKDELKDINTLFGPLRGRKVSDQRSL